MTYDGFKDKVVSTLTLFSSCCTLLCCALPALFVALGAGAAFAGVMSAIPQLAIVSHHKPTLFTVAGVLLTVSAYMQWHNRRAACPTDPRKAAACMRLKRTSAVIFGISLIAYLTGFFFAFAAPYFMQHS